MRRLCLAALILSSLAACDVELDSDRFEIIEIEPRDTPGDTADGPCACASDACLEQWADANLGCSVCVTLVCSDGRHHACSSTCDPPETHAHPVESNK